jgi:hypothetical protein
MRADWGAILRGEPTDIEDWVHVLKKGFDPWVEVHGADTVLRSSSFDELESADHLRDRAVVLIDRLNGAVSLSQGAKPLAFGGAVEFTEDGKLRRTVFAEGHADGRAKVRAVATIVGRDGRPVTAPPQPSDAQAWMVLAESDGFLEDAFIYFGRATDWFDLYKCLECLFLRFGGSEEAFLALHWESEQEIKRLKQSANWPRHAKRKFSPPQRPMTLGDARALLAKLLRRALAEATTRTSC